MGTLETRYRIDSAGIVGKDLEILWGDGHRSRFHPMWLRHQCECSACGSSLDGIRGIRLHHIPHEIAPASLEVTEQGIVVIWNGDQHRSAYSARWLRDHCYSDTERNLRRSKPVHWTAALSPVPEFDYGQMRSSAGIQLAMLETVRDLGFCKVVGVPPDKAHASSFIALVGPQRQTHFGTYDLAKKKSTDNVETPPVRSTRTRTRPTACPASELQCFRSCAQVQTAVPQRSLMALRPPAGCGRPHRKILTC